MKRIGQNFYIEKQFNEQMKKLLLLLIFPIFTFAQEKATEKLELLDQASVWINNTIEIEKKINLKRLHLNMLEYFRDAILVVYKDVNQLGLSADKLIEAKEINVPELVQIQKQYDALEVSDEMKYVFNHLYSLDFEQKTWDKRLNLQKLKGFKEIDPNKFEIKFISSQKKYVTVKCLNKNISEIDFKDLEEISNHIVYFDVYEGQLDDSSIKNILSFKNLVKLDLKHNAITDKGLKLISVLENLEVINLIGTNITEKSLDIFEEFKSLKRVYLWESGIKNDQIDSFNQKQNKITLVGSLK